MGSIFHSPLRTVGAGIVLLVVVVAAATLATGQRLEGGHAFATFVVRWLHVMSGVLWVGLLWYLNFVQVPAIPAIPVEQRGAITGHIMPRVLLFFRHAAVATVVTGLLLAAMQRFLVEALLLRPGFVLIGIGMWMALVMAFNVWVIIWPNQRKVLGLVEASAEQKAVAARSALLASRFNLMLSIAMLYCMVAQQNAPL